MLNQIPECVDDGDGTDSLVTLTQQEHWSHMRWSLSGFLLDPFWQYLKFYQSTTILGECGLGELSDELPLTITEYREKAICRGLQPVLCILQICGLRIFKHVVYPF